MSPHQQELVLYLLGRCISERKVVAQKVVHRLEVLHGVVRPGGDPHVADVGV